MSNIVMENVQEADINPLFAALDSPHDEVTGTEEVSSSASTNGNSSTSVAEQTSPEVKTEQTTASDVQQTQDVTSEIVQLRQLLRTQKIELDMLKDTVVRHDLVQKGDVGTDVPLSELEQLQSDIAELGASREVEITNLLEMMELTPKYEDVKVVCTRQNFDDILDLAARETARTHGINETVALLELEKEVWSQGNPYKYMYELIKTYHPKYASAADASTAAAETATESKRVVAATAPVSIASIGGGDSGITEGWTSSKIDALAETELGKVPADIYEKYLQGTLA